jgi:hypothetical protein
MNKKWDEKESDERVSLLLMFSYFSVGIKNAQADRHNEQGEPFDCQGGNGPWDANITEKLN